MLDRIFVTDSVVAMRGQLYIKLCPTLTQNDIREIIKIAMDASFGKKDFRIETYSQVLQAMTSHCINEVSQLDSTHIRHIVTKQTLYG